MQDFIFRERDSVTLIICPRLEEAGFRHAFSTRLGGTSPLPRAALSLGNFRQDERANVIENRRRFLSALDASDWRLATARQIHSSEVSLVTAEEGAEAPECDALMTDLPRVLLAVQTADCLPILIADERTGATAAVHAGWRGTLARILARTIERMQLAFDSRPQDLLMAMGPAAAACCFEVGDEVVEAFSGRFSYAADLFSRPRAEGKAHLDLNLANERQAVDAGLPGERIYRLGLCTMCRTDLFFSYRRERGAERAVGRLMGVIGRES